MEGSDIVIARPIREKFRFHSAIAECHFDTSETNVLRAIAAAAQILPHFSVFDDCFDDTAQIELAVLTQSCKWRDVLSFHLTEKRSVNQDVFTEIIIFSHSTNVCPSFWPLSIFRCCCDWMRVFRDGGQNAKHIRDVVSEVEHQLKLPSFLEIVYSSR